MRISRSFAWLLAAACLHCGDGAVPTTDDGGDTSDASDTDAATGDSGPASLCPASSPIYVAVDGGSFFSFDPTTYALTQLPIPTCGGVDIGIGNPFAVTHDDRGWLVVEQTSGNPTLWYPFSLLGSSCPTQEAFSVPQASGIESAAYVSNAPGSPSETLYVSTAQAGGDALATLDSKGNLAQIAPLDRAYSLAGTADGRLFGLGHVNADPTSRLVQIAPKTGATTLLATPSISGDIAYARGKLFAFSIVDGGGHGETDVYAFDPKTYAAKKVSHVPYFVSGVATSTCAAP